MPKTKLSELVAKLEEDFDYQYKYNSEILEDSKEAYEVIETLRAKLRDSMKSANLWYNMWLWTASLLTGSAVYIIYKLGGFNV